MTLEFDRVHADDCVDCDERSDGLIERVRSDVTIHGELTAAQRARLAQVAQRCPVHKTLAHGLHIDDAVTFVDPARVTPYGSRDRTAEPHRQNRRSARAGRGEGACRTANVQPASHCRGSSIKTLTRTTLPATAFAFQQGVAGRAFLRLGDLRPSPS